MAADAPVIGIDFGTSKCCVAWVNPADGKAELLRNAEGEERTPSAVYFGNAEPVVGQLALELLEDEHERARVVQSVKRNLLAAATLSLPGGRRITPREVAVAIFAKLRRDADEFQFHTPVTRAVITCPAAFGPLERDAISTAAREAGFIDVVLLDEPVAAALAYVDAGYNVGDQVLVYDFGAGTFDLALLVRNDTRGFRLALPPRGLKNLGGDDFDRMVYDYWDVEVVRQRNRHVSSDPTLVDPWFLARCRQQKERLSEEGVTRTMWSYLGTPPRLDLHIDRTRFDQLISVAIEESIEQTRILLDEAKAAGSAPSAVLLVGGSSRILLVAKRLADTMPIEPVRWQFQDFAVALGAAIHARRCWQSPEKKSTATKRPSTSSRSSRAASDRLLEAGRYSEALAAYEQQAKIATTRADKAAALGGKSLALFGMERYSDALETSTQALELSPSDTVSLRVKSAALVEPGRGQEGLDVFRRARALAPNLAEDLSSKREAVFRSRRYLEVLEKLEDARVHTGVSASGLLRNAEGLARGTSTAALSMLERARRQQPELTRSVAETGGDLVEQTRRQALAGFKKARGATPDVARGLRNKGEELLKFRWKKDR